MSDPVAQLTSARQARYLVEDGIEDRGMAALRPASRLLVCVAVVVLAACRRDHPVDSDALPEGVTIQLIEEGRILYGKQGFCYTCHDYDGTGGAGPDLTDDEWWHNDGSFERITATILSGVSGEESRGGITSAMEPRGGTSLPDEQIRALAAYVWSLSREGLEAPGS